MKILVLCKQIVGVKRHDISCIIETIKINTRKKNEFAKSAKQRQQQVKNHNKKKFSVINNYAIPIGYFILSLSQRSTIHLNFAVWYICFRISVFHSFIEATCPVVRKGSRFSNENNKEWIFWWNNKQRQKTGAKKETHTQTRSNDRKCMSVRAIANKGRNSVYVKVWCVYVCSCARIKNTIEYRAKGSVYRHIQNSSWALRLCIYVHVYSMYI